MAPGVPKHEIPFWVSVNALRLAGDRNLFKQKLHSLGFPKIILGFGTFYNFMAFWLWSEFWIVLYTLYRKNHTFLNYEGVISQNILISCLNTKHTCHCKYSEWKECMLRGYFHCYGWFFHKKIYIMASKESEKDYKLIQILYFQINS